MPVAIWTESLQSCRQFVVFFPFEGHRQCLESRAGGVKMESSAQVRVEYCGRELDWRSYPVDCRSSGDCFV